MLACYVPLISVLNSYLFKSLTLRSSATYGCHVWQQHSVDVANRRGLCHSSSG
jgi:hypothetical protein